MNCKDGGECSPLLTILILGELEKEDLTKSHLVAIYLYVRSMADFAQINTQFCFALNPPVR